MKSKTTQAFRNSFKKLPIVIQEQARQSYKRFCENPWHPGLQFKQVHSKRPIFSARINKDYRAVGVIDDIEIIWFWIGSHSDYDKLLKQM